MIDFTLITALLLATLRLSTPLLFASMGGLLSERSGVINIALEGFILLGAFSGASFAFYTSNEWWGFLFAGAIGALSGLLFAAIVLFLKADQIIAGMAFNLFAMGIIPFCSKIIFNSTGSTPSLSLENRFSFEPMIMSLLGVALVYTFLRFTKAGLWVLFAGEKPEALTASGVSLIKVRLFAVATSGALAALGGASLSLFLASSYSPLMSGGRGFMALAAMIFGKWKPLPTLFACFLFAFADAIQIRLQGIRLGTFEIPVQFIQVLPYLVTIIALAGFMGKSSAPKALGQKT